MTKRRFLSSILAILSVISCTNPKESLKSAQNTIVKTKLETQYLTDTIFVSLPKETITTTTDDTLSVLSTSLARSEAQIRNGKLIHLLTNVAHELPVPVQTKIITNDSIVYVDRTVVAKKPTSPLLKISAIANLILISLGMFALLLRLRSRK